MLCQDFLKNYFFLSQKFPNQLTILLPIIVKRKIELRYYRYLVFFLISVQEKIG